MFFTPKPEPLSPWSRLWPALRNVLQGSAKTRNPDLPKLLRMWSRGEVVHRIPHESRRVWAERIALWVDRGSRTLPFRSDQNEVYRRLLDCSTAAGIGACKSASLTVRTRRQLRHKEWTMLRVSG